MPDHSYYKVGGSLDYQHPSYVVRQADHDLYEGLKNGEFCYVLNSRQMGKSSLRVQMMKRLKEEGIRCAAIDMSRIGCHVTAAECYGGVVSELMRGFSLSKKIEFSTWWRQRELLSPVQRLGEFVEDVLLKEFSENIVIFMDEIDSILKFDFKCDFFAFIRGCYNRRADNPDYNRLTFCLLGVAAPSDLITGKASTPFNIGRAVELTGFQLHEAESLAQGLSGNAANPTAVLTEILTWTGGQPFLTQKLCKLVSNLEEPIPADQETKRVENLVQSRIIDNWETQDEPEHLRTIRDRILYSNRREELLKLYRKIRTQKSKVKTPKDIAGEVKVNDTHEQIELRLSGLVVRHNSKLAVYNRIYAAVFNLNWVNAELTKQDNSRAKDESARQIINIKELLNNPGIPAALSRKLIIDLMIADDEKLQQFLQWLDEKATSVKTYYSQSLIRAFYLDFVLADYYAPLLDLGLVYAISPKFLFPSTLEGASSHNLAFQYELCFDLGLTPALDWDDSLPHYALAWDIDVALDQDLILNDELREALQALKIQLPPKPSKYISQKWWRISGQSWIEQLRTVMMKHRNIGHNWQFTKQEKDLLQKYYNANKELMHHLNSSFEASLSCRQRIEKALLLPFAKLPIDEFENFPFWEGMESGRTGFPGGDSNILLCDVLGSIYPNHKQPLDQLESTSVSTMEHQVDNVSSIETHLHNSSSIAAIISSAESQKYHLTKRESEVWFLRRAGFSYKKIAEQLFITLNTVKKHLKNIRCKIDYFLDEEIEAAVYEFSVASPAPYESSSIDISNTHQRLVTAISYDTEQTFLGEIEINNKLVRIYQGDITNLAVDVIVSSDDTEIPMSGSVGWRIRCVGGEAIYQEAQQLVPIPLGRVAVTTAGRLRAKRIFHAVVIDWLQENTPSHSVICQAVHACMEKANQAKFQSIAFPILGTGAGGFPVKAAWDSVLAQVVKDLSNQEQTIKEVVIVLYGKQAIQEIHVTEFLSEVERLGWRSLL